MRALLQRVTKARVRVEGHTVGEIDRGLLVFLGVAPSDDEWVASGMAAKVAGMRIFADSEGLTNLSLGEVAGAALVVSQFTLYADARRGRRPSFVGAAGPVVGERLYEVFCEILASTGVPVRQGSFGAHMEVDLTNDGPFTVWLDSAELGIEPHLEG
ncbi:MAG: D-aminoacyl-tRNA deacylase [Candidatus Limnocylindrales bacterium]